MGTKLARMIGIGAPVSVHPGADPLADIRWADSRREIDAVWFIDHLQGWFPRGVDTELIADPHELLDPFALMAAGAAQTERVQIGVSVTDPLRRSAAALAQTAGSISWLGRRQMVLGLGVGDPGQLRPFGLHSGRERTGRLSYVRPALRTLDALRREPTDGGPGIAIAESHGYSLYVAAHGPKMLELTAQHGDGWIPSSLPPDVYRAKLGELRRNAESIGRDPAAIKPVLFVWAALGTTRAESEKQLAHPSVRAVALYRGPDGFKRHGGTYPLEHGYIPHDVPADKAASIMSGIPAGVVREAVLHGSPADVRQRLAEYAEAGCEHVIVYDIGRYTDREGTDRSRESLLAIAGA